MGVGFLENEACSDRHRQRLLCVGLRSVSNEEGVDGAVDYVHYGSGSARCIAKNLRDAMENDSPN